MNVTNDFTKGSSITQILLNRLQKNGFPETTVEPIAIDLESTAYGVIRSNAFFSSIIFIAQALNRSFDLAVNARVVQVLTEKDKVIGVKVMSPDKRSYFLKAKIVVMSARTLQTPRILLHSGIQGRAIGHYLTNHSVVIGNGKVNRNQFPEILGPLRILVQSTEERTYQIHISGPGNYWWDQYKEQPLQEEWRIQLIALGKIEAQFDNKVTLDPLKLDDDGVPELQVNFTYSPQDEVVIQQMAEGVKQASSAMKAPLVSTDGGPPIYRRPPGGDHAMGQNS